MIPSILSVLDELGISHPESKSSFNINCMFCNDKNKHLNISVHKNAWRCSRCDESGGSLGLYAKIKNISTKEVEQYFFELYRYGGKKITPIIEYNAETVRSEKIPKVPYEYLNKVYRELVKILTLQKCDMDELLARGLSEKQIKSMCFKTVSDGLNYAVAHRLIERGFKLDNIAGFVKYNGDWAFKASFSGILIPYVNSDRLMIAFQIRQRNYTKRKKYIWLSTEYLNERNGYSDGYFAQTTAHIVGWHEGVKSVCLTEGALKGDIAYHLANVLYGKSVPYLCIAGVNNTKNLTEALNTLKQHGVTTIYNCLDMDREESSIIYNPNVGKANKRIVALVKELGFNIFDKRWDSRWKGIDDYLKSIYDEKMNKCNKAA